MILGLESIALRCLIWGDLCSSWERVFVAFLFLFLLLVILYIAIDLKMSRK